MTLIGQRPATPGVTRTMTRKRLDHVKGMRACLRELALFSASCARLGGVGKPVNICPDCLERRCLSLAPEAAHLCALGLCGHCDAVTGVFDLDLLKLYRAFDIPVDEIAARLPLLRQEFPHRPALRETRILSILSRYLASKVSDPDQSQIGGKR